MTNPKPVSIETYELPELPRAAFLGNLIPRVITCDVFTADQMHDFRAEGIRIALEAERAARHAAVPAEDEAVLKAADLWWQGHRPLDYTRTQHIKNPTVNADYTGRAHALATAVGKRAAVLAVATSQLAAQPQALEDAARTAAAGGKEGVL